MLVEFRVRNFRSFKDDAILSMVASKDQTNLAENTVAVQAPSALRLTRSAAIYGANASGKTNILRALGFMAGVVQQSAALPPNQTFALQPFRLDRDTVNAPSLFEITLVLDDKRYQYGFEMTPTRIVAEWLLVYETAKGQTWFERKAEGETDVYRFGSHLPGPKRLWQEATRPNALFLSTAVQLNSEALTPLHAWLTGAVTVLFGGGQLSFDFSTALAAAPEGQRRLIAMMGAADIAISAISTRPAKGFRQHLNFDFANGRTSAQAEEIETQMPMFEHRSGTETAEFEFTDESEGTQKLFSLAAPLFDILETGRLLAIDELDRSLHPLLVRRIVETFQDPVLNRKGAQLVFTTHDTSLLHGGLLRRDQIWFTEKLADQSSTLMPLSDFSARKGEAFEKNYLGGRYGGAPILARRLLTRAEVSDG